MGSREVKRGPDSRSAYHPTMSTTTWVAPVFVAMVIVPPAPTRTVAALGMVSPLAKLTVELVGCGSPVGYTERNEPAVLSVTVMLATIAVASAGTPPTPVTFTVLGIPAAILAF